APHSQRTVPDGEAKFQGGARESVARAQVDIVERNGSGYDALAHPAHRRNELVFAWRKRMTRLLIRDDGVGDDLIQERKRRGLDLYDEVWEGMYVMPSMPNNVHQELVDDLGAIFNEVIKRPGLGKTYPGVNVSDRRKGWEHNYRVPDLAVVLNK